MMEEREEWSCEEAKCRAKSEVSRSGVSCEEEVR